MNFALPILLAMIFGGSLHAQQVGEFVFIQSDNPDGVPVHPAPGDAHYIRWGNKTYGVVTAVDIPTGWRNVASANGTGWIITKYLTVIRRPVLRYPAMSAEKKFELTIDTATLFRTIIIESSTNLVNWTPVSTNVFLGYPGFVFNDPDNQSGQRFYRAASW